jgi:hypothetical protein
MELYSLYIYIYIYIYICCFYLQPSADSHQMLDACIQLTVRICRWWLKVEATHMTNKIVHKLNLPALTEFHIRKPLVSSTAMTSPSWSSVKKNGNKLRVLCITQLNQF